MTVNSHGVYLRAFGWGEVVYAMLVKIYGHSSEGQRRYSPARLHRGRADPRHGPID